MEEVVDCTIKCNMILKIINSCPTREIELSPYMTQVELVELIMVALSTTPYILSFLLLLFGTYYRTTRAVFILSMLFVVNFLSELIKNSLRDPRPNFNCTKQFGNPSNHAAFYSSLVIWMLMENFTLPRRFRFSNNFLKWLLFIIFPFVCYARVYLQYHSPRQVQNGIILGALVGIFWFILADYFILKTDNVLKRLMIKFYVRNNMSKEEFINLNRMPSNKLFQEFERLNKKKEALGKMKHNIKHMNHVITNLKVVKMAKDTYERNEKARQYN